MKISTHRFWIIVKKTFLPVLLEVGTLLEEPSIQTLSRLSPHPPVGPPQFPCLSQAWSRLLKQRWKKAAQRRGQEGKVGSSPT